MFNFDENIERRGTQCIKWDTVPESVIPLSIADADWATAPAVLDAVRKRLDAHPVFGYGRDEGGLTDEVVGWYRRKYGITIEKSWIIIHSGIVPALEKLSALADGSVLAGTPNYSMLLSAPQRAGKALTTSPLRVWESGAVLSYEYDFANLETHADAGAQILYLCNPHNPIGKVYTREELAKLSDFVQNKNLISVSDEIHCELTYDKKHIPWFTVKPENSVTLIAPGKICNMPGIPIGLAVVPDASLRDRVRRLLGHGGGGSLNSAAAAGAFSEAADGWKAELLSYLTANRDFLESEIPKRFPKARYTHNDGTYLQWLDLTGYRISGNAQKYLLEHAKVALTGGVEFGGSEHTVRLNFATSRSTLTEALNRIELALD